MEKNKNDRVPVKGTISRESAEVWRRGDLKSNNGLRQSKGRARLVSEKTDLWIDKGPTIWQQLWEGVKQDLAIIARREANRVICEELLPRGRDLVWNKLVPAAGKKLHELRHKETKSSVLLRKKAAASIHAYDIIICLKTR
jgi:hypothetical protein